MGNTRPDEVTRALLECEAALRSLSKQGRLGVEALQAFLDLSKKVRMEMERRRGGDRRQTMRSSPDRRTIAHAREAGEYIEHG